MNAFEKEDDLLRLNMLDELDYFVCKVKQSGAISQRDYQKFTSSLNKLGYPFDIKISHYKQRYVPIYDDPSDYSTFTGKIARVEELFSDSEIKDCLFPKDGTVGKTYKMSKGDYITVSIKSKVKSKYQKFRSVFLGAPSNEVFFQRLGGVIQNETE